MSARKLPLPSKARRVSVSPPLRVSSSSFNPALPEDDSLIVASVLRDQFTGLQQLIAAIPAGPPGPPGPPIGNVACGPVTQVNPGDPATAQVTWDGTAATFYFGLPRGFTGATGGQGEQGPPFANAVVDGTTTLPPQDQAQVSSWFDGSTVHLTFAIPRGYDGPPGEVTTAQMEGAIQSAINGTARNPNGVTPLNIMISDPPTQGEVVQIMDKVNELIVALFRSVP